MWGTFCSVDRRGPDRKRSAHLVIRSLATAGFAAFALLLLLRAEALAQAPVREHIEWSHTWLMAVNSTDKPHVLLIGDSITEAVFGRVEARFKDTAYLCKLTTSKSLGDPLLFDEVRTTLRNTHFEVIHFNNGMHGVGYTEAQYARDYARMLRLIKAEAPRAKLVLVTTTSQRTPGQLDRLTDFNERIKVRNQTVRRLAAKNGLLVNDLFALVADRQDFTSGDGTHLSAAGIDAQADRVCAVLEPLIK